MATDRRHLWLGVFIGLLIFLSGCATRGSVRRLSADVTALQAKVETTGRDLAGATAMLRQTETRLLEHSRSVETLNQRVERLERFDARLQEFERTLKDVKASVEALRPQVAARPPERTAEPADKIYMSAQAHYQAGNYGQAVLEFLDLIQSHPRHPLAENAQYWIAAAYMAQRDYRQATIEFRKVLDQYPGGRKSPDALYQLGLAHRSLLDPRRAREVWQQVIRQYPESDAARLARGALRSGSAGRRSTR